MAQHHVENHFAARTAVMDVSEILVRPAPLLHKGYDSRLPRLRSNLINNNN
jgi:hypothetical protein